MSVKKLKIDGKKYILIILMGEDEKNTLHGNGNDTSKKHGHSAKKWLVSVSFILFLFNIWKYLDTPGAFLFYR